MTDLAKALDHPARFRVRLTEITGLALRKEVGDETSEDGEVFRAVIGAVTGGVLVEGDIEHPVQAVFDVPMEANGAGEAVGRGAGRGQVVAEGWSALVAASLLGGMRGLSFRVMAFP